MHSPIRFRCYTWRSYRAKRYKCIFCLIENNEFTRVATWPGPVRNLADNNRVYYHRQVRCLGEDIYVYIYIYLYESFNLSCCPKLYRTDMQRPPSPHVMVRMNRFMKTSTYPLFPLLSTSPALPQNDPPPVLSIFWFSPKYSQNDPPPRFINFLVLPPNTPRMIPQDPQTHFINFWDSTGC